MTLPMSIVKVEIKIPELVKAVDIFKRNNQKFFEIIATEIKSSVSNTLNNLLQAEIEIRQNVVDGRLASGDLVM